MHAFMDRRNKDEIIPVDLLGNAKEGKSAGAVTQRTASPSENVMSTSSEIHTIYPATEALVESGEIKTPPDMDLEKPAASNERPKLPQLASLKRNEILLSNVPEDTTLVKSAMETIFETSNIDFKPDESVAIIRFETEEDALLAIDIARTFQLNEVDSRHIVWCDEMMTPVLRIENLSRDTMEEKLFSDFPDLKSVKLKHMSHKCVAVLEFETPYIAAKNYPVAKKMFGKDAEVYHVIHSDWRKSNLPLRDPPSITEEPETK